MERSDREHEKKTILAYHYSELSALSQRCLTVTLYVFHIVSPLNQSLLTIKKISSLPNQSHLNLNLQPWYRYVLESVFRQLLQDLSANKSLIAALQSSTTLDKSLQKKLMATASSVRMSTVSDALRDRSFRTAAWESLGMPKDTPFRLCPASWSTEISAARSTPLPLRKCICRGRMRTATTPASFWRSQMS